MSQSTAKFLLEFQATGDQEIAQKFRDIGSAGQEAATQLQELQGAGEGIEGSLSGIAGAAGEATGPLDEMGTATEALGTSAESVVSPLDEMSTTTEGLGGIFSEAGTGAEELGSSLDTMGSATEGLGTTLDDMGASTESLGGIFSGAGTEADTFGGALSSMNDSAMAVEGGLTDASLGIGNFSGATAGATGETQGFGSSVGQISGTVAALGGTIGSTVSALFRYQDIQFKVQKAQLASQRAIEGYRKAQAGLDKILATATKNEDGIAAARQRLADAQGRVNELMAAGVTSGAEWEAAQKELQAAQAALAEEFRKGGGDVAKLTGAMEKSELAAGKMEVAANALEKANRTANQSILDMVFGFAGLGGSIVTAGADIGKLTGNLKNLGTAIKGSAVFAGLTAGLGAIAGLATKANAGLLTLKLGLTGVTGAAAPLIAILGPAALAVGGFLLAIKGIEAIKPQAIAFFSSIGKAIGDLLPPLKGFLTDLGKASEESTNFLIRNTNRLLGIEKQNAATLFDLINMRIKKSADLTAAQNTSADEIINSLRREGESYEQAGARILPVLWHVKEGHMTLDEALKKIVGSTGAAGQASDAYTAKLQAMGVGTADNMVATEGISDAIAALPPIIGSGTTASGQLTNAMDMMTRGEIEAGKGIMNELIPAINSLIGGTGAVLSDIQLFNNALGQNTSSAVLSATNMFALMQGEIVNLGGGFSSVNGMIMKTTPEMERLGTSIDTTTKNLETGRTALQNQQAALTQAVSGVQQYTDAQGFWTDTQKATNDEIDRQSKLVGALQSETSAATKAYLEAIGAGDKWAASLDTQVASTQAMIDALREQDNQQKGIQAAIIGETLALEQSNQKYREATAIRDNEVAATARLDTAIRDMATALVEEGMALDASIEATSDKVVQQLALENATKQGVLAAHEWVASLDEAKAAQDAEQSSLASFGHTFSNLPGVIAPTVENVKKFAEAARMGGVAAVEAGQEILDSWSRLTGDMGSKIQGLVDIVKKGGDSMKESTATWFADLEADIGRKLTGAETAAINTFRSMVTHGQQILSEFNLDAMLGNVEGGMQQMVSSFREAASNSTGVWKTIFSTMAEIAASGSKDAVARMTEAFNSGAPADAILAQMQTIKSELPTLTGTAATTAGDTMKGKLDPGAAAAGQSAALTLSQEFAAAGTHIAAVIKGINAQIAKIGTGAKMPKLGVNIQNIMQNTAKATKLINAVKQKTPPKMGVNIQNILQNTARAQNAINSVKQRTPPRMGVNIQNALTNIQRVKSAIASVRGKTVYIDVRQRQVGPRYAATGFHGEVSQPTMIMVGEKGRERVTVEPIGTHHPPMGGTKGGYSAGGGGGGRSPMIIKGDVLLDAHKVGRFVGRAIAENNV